MFYVMFQCCNVIVACCILHNIAKDMNQAEPEELPEEPELPDRDDAPFGFVQDGVARRQHIATTHFSCK